MAQENRKTSQLDDLEKLADLRNRGLLTEDEYKRKKKQILQTAPTYLESTEPKDTKQISGKVPQKSVRKPNRFNRYLAIFIVIGMIAGISLCIYAVKQQPSPQSVMPIIPTHAFPDIVYEITGSAKSADVTLSNSTGGTEQFGNVTIPWSYTDKSFSGRFLYISAQNKGEYGTVTVSIYMDGQLFKTSTSSGEYVIASASGWR